MYTSQGPRSSPYRCSPFPTFHESQRDGQSTTSFQDADAGQSRHMPASTTSLHQRPSPPVAAQMIPGQVRYATSPLYHATGPDDGTEPPAPIGSVNRQTILHQITTQHDRSRSQSVLLRDRISQTSTALDSVPHPVRPRFMSLDSFQVTPELLAEIDHPHSMSQGMSGVAYAGGALSGPVSRSIPIGPSSLPNESTLEHVRNGNILNLGQSELGETSTTLQSRNINPCDQNRETLGLHRRGSVMREPPQRMPAQEPSPTLAVQLTNPPKEFPSLGDPCHPASYSPVDHELRSALAAAPSPNLPVPRQDVLCTEPLRSTPHSVALIPDRSFPIQEESPTVSSGPAAAHDRDSRASHSHPESSIPPDPRSYIIAPSTSPIITRMSREKGKNPVLPPYSPVKSVDLPYPDPFERIRRKSNASPDDETTGNPQIDFNSARERLALSQTFALNTEVMVSDSTLSPSSAPFPGPQYNPWTFSHTCSSFNGRRSGIANEQASTRWSPSHEPIPLPPLGRGSRGRCRSQDLCRRSKTRTPPRAESTQPRDTSPELSSSEKTSVESMIRSEPQQSAPEPASPGDESADDEEYEEKDDGRWIDEDLEVGCSVDRLLHLDDAKKGCRRCKLPWEALRRNLRALDREADTPFVFLAAPSHTGKLHSVASRTVRHDSSLKPAEMTHIRSAFAEIASRHATRTPSLLEQLSRDRLSSYDGPSSSSGGAREEDLLRALDTAIGSLHVLGDIYERRETRWAEEKLRLDEDNDKVQLLLKQVLGPGVFGNLTNKAR